MSEPYLGQVVISDQRVLFVYVGEGYYCNTVQRHIVGPDDVAHMGFTPLIAGSEYRLYER